MRGVDGPAIFQGVGKRWWDLWPGVEAIRAQTLHDGATVKCAPFAHELDSAIAAHQPGGYDALQTALCG